MEKINELVIPCIARYSACFKSNRKMIPKGIVVHSTGADNPYLYRYVKNEELFGKNIYNNFFGTKNGGEGIPHMCIGLDKYKEVKCAQLLPFDVCCWGCGRGEKGSYNYDPPFIQFEMCEDNLENSVYFHKVIDLATSVCAALCALYDIEIPNIVSHKEAHAQGYASNHGDPENWFDVQGYSMEKFRDDVRKKLGRKPLYKVQVGAFTKYNNAAEYMEKVRAAGFPAFISTEIL